MRLISSSTTKATEYKIVLEKHRNHSNVQKEIYFILITSSKNTAVVCCIPYATFQEVITSSLHNQSMRHVQQTHLIPQAGRRYYLNYLAFHSTHLPKPCIFHHLKDTGKLYIVKI